MKIYNISSKVILLIISVLVVINAIFLSKEDTWAVDMFYYLPVFTLVIVFDFMFYEIYCLHSKGKNHLIYCTFPLSRWKVLVLEIKYFFRRWEILVFIGSVQFYQGYFYTLNNSKVFPILIILLVYSLQTIYTVCILFIIKNFLNSKNFESNIKNIVSLFVTFIILIYTLAGKSNFFNHVFFINPLAGGFLSYLLGSDYGIMSLLSIIILSILIGLISYKKFREWPL